MLLCFYTFASTCITQEQGKQQVARSREMSRDAEFGMVKALDYLLQMFSVAPLAIQCVLSNTADYLFVSMLCFSIFFNN